MTKQSPWWWLPLGTVPEVASATLHARMTSGEVPQILDVRTIAEWRVSRIQGAVSVPITSLKARLLDLDLDPASPTIAVCLSAHRSIPAVRLLRHVGFTDVYQLRGGMLAWWNASLPTISSP